MTGQYKHVTYRPVHIIPAASTLPHCSALAHTGQHCSTSYLLSPHYLVHHIKQHHAIPHQTFLLTSCHNTDLQSVKQSEAELVFGADPLLFLVTFTTSVLSAGLGLAKCLKVGAAQTSLNDVFDDSWQDNHDNDNDDLMEMTAT